MKKTIATKKIKRWQKIDRLVVLVPLLVFFGMSVGKSGRQLWAIVMDEGNVGVTAAAFLLFLLPTAFTSLPVILLWRAVSHTVKKAAIRSATFRITEDFDYYREKLTGIRPAAISLLMDLQMETKKDIAALLLWYVKMGVVSIEEGKVRILNREHPDLLSSDRALLELIDKGQVQPANLRAWKQQAVKEAVQSGYIKQRGAQQNVQSAAGSCLRGCFEGCLLPILLFVGMGIGGMALQNSGRLDLMEQFLEAAPEEFGMRQVEYFLSSPDMIVTAALMVLAVLPLFIILWLPFAAVLRIALSAANENIWLKRTEEGEILAAQILGLKNFLRDYSILSMAEKEQLLLWDDFLIYAVVLEENERIVEDIFNMKNLRYQDFILF